MNPEFNEFTPEQKAWIDNASLYSLLYKNRFEPVSSGWFQGERGAYHLKVMNEKRAIDPGGWVAASKEMGW